MAVGQGKTITQGSCMLMRCQGRVRESGLPRIECPISANRPRSPYRFPRFAQEPISISSSLSRACYHAKAPGDCNFPVWYSSLVRYIFILFLLCRKGRPRSQKLFLNANDRFHGEPSCEPSKPLRAFARIKRRVNVGVRFYCIGICLSQIKFGQTFNPRSNFPKNTPYHGRSRNLYPRRVYDWRDTSLREIYRSENLHVNLLKLARESYVQSVGEYEISSSSF